MHRDGNKRAFSFFISLLFATSTFTSDSCSPTADSNTLTCLSAVSMATSLTYPGHSLLSAKVPVELAEDLKAAKSVRVVQQMAFFSVFLLSYD